MPGLRLSELFYKECVKPILDSEFPKMKYAAGRIEYGSEVLGFDTPLSMDHDWGPRLEMFLQEKDFKNARKISKILSKRLPPTFRGFSTHWGKTSRNGSAALEAHKSGPIRHRVKLYTTRSFFQS